MQYHHHSLHNIFNDFKYIYQYRGSHTKIKDELYPWETCAITRETIPFRRSKDEAKMEKPKLKSRSFHHIAHVTRFPTSQEFCNFDSVWEGYVNFSEDAQKFLLHTVSHFSPRVANYQRETWLIKKWNVWYLFI